MKAFGYLRVSGKGQEQGDGFPRQRDAVLRLAQSLGIYTVCIYQEQVTGTSDADEREAWSAMIEEAKLTGIKRVIIERLDRLARDLMVQETIVRDLRRAGIELLSSAEPDLLSTDPTRVLIRQMLGSVAQYDKSQIVIKLKAARDRVRRTTGRCEGRKPYGENAGESETLARILALHAAGISINGIARTLNAEGLKPRTAENWHPQTVHGILQASRRQ
jgi:DNA invertase Pin-like site-specific DNA recombinase